MTDTERTINVLMVDDEEDLVTLMARRLAKRGMDVATATSGVEALELASRRRFDVAVVDLKMPGMDGVEVMQRLREVQPFIQTIMFTGHGTTESALEAGKLDAFRYVMKPCPFDELIEIIREAHRSKRTELRRLFQEEMRTVMNQSSTASDILAAGERLRQKYEQD